VSTALEESGAEPQQVAKSAAADVGRWWVRRHPRQAAKLAGIVARHPRRTAQLVSEAQTLRVAAPDPRVQRLGRHAAGLRNHDLTDLVDPAVWAELAVVAGAAVAAHSEARERKARRRRRRRTMVVISVAALTGALAYRRASSASAATR
jgi:hypothetical protein